MASTSVGKAYTSIILSTVPSSPIKTGPFITHFTNENTGLARFKDLSKVTISGKASA